MTLPFAVKPDGSVLSPIQAVLIRHTDCTVCFHACSSAEEAASEHESHLKDGLSFVCELYRERHKKAFFQSAVWSDLKALRDEHASIFEKIAELKKSGANNEEIEQLSKRVRLMCQAILDE